MPVITDARERLKKLREGSERKSEEVVEVWEESLADFHYKIPDQELWLLYEQVCIAACDCGRIDLAQVGSVNYSLTYSVVNIVVCQLGGVSDEPPWLRAATRHGPGIL